MTPAEYKAKVDSFMSATIAEYSDPDDPQSINVKSSTISVLPADKSVLELWDPVVTDEIINKCLRRSHVRVKQTGNLYPNDSRKPFIAELNMTVYEAYSKGLVEGVNAVEPERPQFGAAQIMWATMHHEELSANNTVTLDGKHIGFSQRTAYGNGCYAADFRSAIIEGKDAELLMVYTDWGSSSDEVVVKPLNLQIDYCESGLLISDPRHIKNDGYELRPVFAQAVESQRSPGKIEMLGLFNEMDERVGFAFATKPGTAASLDCTSWTEEFGVEISSELSDVITLNNPESPTP